MIVSIYVTASGGSFIILIPNCFVVTSELSYLIFAHRGAKIPHAVSITLDLVTLLFTLAIGILFAPSVGGQWSCSQPDEEIYDCKYWARVNAAQSACIIIVLRSVSRIFISKLLLSNCVTSTIHFVLFVRDIMVFRREKRTIQRGLRLAEMPTRNV